jgi:hypothetical protein
VYNPYYRVSLVSLTYWDLQWKEGHHQNYNSTVIRTKFHLGFISYSWYQLLLQFLCPRSLHLSEKTDSSESLSNSCSCSSSLIVSNTCNIMTGRNICEFWGFCSSVAQDFVLLGYDAMSWVNHMHHNVSKDDTALIFKSK